MKEPVSRRGLRISAPMKWRSGITVTQVDTAKKRLTAHHRRRAQAQVVAHCQEEVDEFRWLKAQNERKRRDAWSFQIEVGKLPSNVTEFSGPISKRMGDGMLDHHVTRTGRGRLTRTLTRPTS